jgi:hypothetical protein
MKRPAILTTLLLLVMSCGCGEGLNVVSPTLGSEPGSDSDNPVLREKLRAVTQKAMESKLSPLFATFSQDRLSREYDPSDWAIGPFARIDRLIFEKKSQWEDPWRIGWEGRAIHNASLIEDNGRLYMFYRCNPAMESLSARIGLAIYTEGTGWIDDGENPIIYSTLENEDLGCEDPKIYRAEGRYFLFYEAVFAPSAEDRARYSDPHYPVGDVGAEINVAESTDLIHWEKKGPVLPRSLSHLWAKAAVIAKAGNGDAIRINGKYMMFISEGCGGKQIIGTSGDMRHWDFKPEQFLDTSRLGKLFEVDSCVAESANSDQLIVDFFYDDHSGVARAGEALYAKSRPTQQLALNRGGTLNVGGLIRYQGRWIHAQGWDAPRGRTVMYVYGTQK